MLCRRTPEATCTGRVLINRNRVGTEDGRPPRGVHPHHGRIGATFDGGDQPRAVWVGPQVGPGALRLGPDPSLGCGDSGGKQKTTWARRTDERCRTVAQMACA
ncbi:hypothetical protein CU044_2735 [Streptomyces sp. L-9-10]|nr:hypothetical protein CU044_2735 [Streptomyces sp. L-9-10]